MSENLHDLELWTYPQVAARIKCCVKHLRDKYVKPGILNSVQVGNRVRFRPSDVEDFIRRLGLSRQKGFHESSEG